MTLEGALFVLLLASVPGDWLVFAILFSEAVRKPYITALVLMAIIAGLISFGLTAYVLAVFNAAAGYFLPKEFAQTALRMAFIGFALFPFLFLWLYRTGRFRDGGL